MAGSTFSRIKTWIAGQTLTASDLNAEFDNILNNLDPTGIDDESATNATAQATKDPYAGSSLVKAVSLEEEIQEIRYILKQITGQAYWYVDPDCVSSKGSYAADAEASDTYVITLDPVPATYYVGMVINFKPNTANTGACTINVNTLGAKSIKKHHDVDPATGDIEANQIVTIVYDGTNFEMQSQLGRSDLCRIKTGTYTGDGTEGQAITGVGFTPKYVKIWDHITSEVDQEIFEKLDQSWGNFIVQHGIIPTHEHRSLPDKINSLDADGFTVDDAGGDAAPNRDTNSYDYLALG